MEGQLYKKPSFQEFFVIKLGKSMSSFSSEFFFCGDFMYVVVNFLFQLIFIFPLFWGMVMYGNEFKTKEKQKLTEIKN